METSMTKLPFRSFLSAGKHALDRLRPVGPRSSNVRPGKRDDDGVLLVVGNESADLDSLISSLILSFVWSRQPHWHSTSPTTTTIATKQQSLPKRRLLPVPVLPIERKRLRLRPEFKAALGCISITADDLITLDDLGVPTNGDGKDSNKSGDNVESKSIENGSNGESENSGPISPDNVSVFLVDHNKLVPPLGPGFDSRVIGCIDHHVDERFDFSSNKTDRVFVRSNDDDSQDCGPVSVAIPRVISPCGSCTSHILRWCVDNELWTFGADADAAVRAIESGVCKLALASILIDTADMTADFKITPEDEWAVSWLNDRIVRLDGQAVDCRRWFKELKDAELMMDELTVREMLGRDYKEWTQTSGEGKEEKAVAVGVAVAIKSLRYIVDKAVKESQVNGGEADPIECLVKHIKSFADEKELDLVALMTAFSPTGGSDDFQRELVVWSATNRGFDTATRFMSKQAHLSSSLLGVGKADGEAKSVEGGCCDLRPADWDGRDVAPSERSISVPAKEEGINKLWIWKQNNETFGRKQVAPLLRRAADEALAQEDQGRAECERADRGMHVPASM